MMPLSLQQSAIRGMTIFLLMLETRMVVDEKQDLVKCSLIFIRHAMMCLE